MFGFFSEGRLLLLGVLALAISAAYSYYLNEIQSRDSRINKLQNDAIVQDVKLENFNTVLELQENNASNSVFEAVQKSKKEEIQDEPTVTDSDINVSSGKHSITI